MKKYWHALNIGIQNNLTYRFNFFARAVFGLIPLIAVLYVWRTIYAGKPPGASVGTYTLAEMISGLMEKPGQNAATKEALAKWHRPAAAAQIAGQMLDLMARDGVRVAPLAKPDEPHASAPARPDPVQLQTANVA